jgi:kinesin family protein 22
VEAEVARRLEERERERELEREKERQLEREKEKEAGSSRHRTKSPRKDLADLVGRSPKTKGSELPPGLTPLLKRHKDLDDELQARLAELERKLFVFEPTSGHALGADALFAAKEGTGTLGSRTCCHPCRKRRRGAPMWRSRARIRSSAFASPPSPVSSTLFPPSRTICTDDPLFLFIGATYRSHWTCTGARRLTCPITSS